MRRFLLVLYVVPRRALHRAGTDLEDHVLNYWKNVGKRELAKARRAGWLSNHLYSTVERAACVEMISKRWRKGNGVSAVWVEWASGLGNGSGARFGTGNFVGLGKCGCGRGAGLAGCTSGLGISGRDTNDGEKCPAASDGYAHDGADF